jgi:hypothetical protein
MHSGSNDHDTACISAAVARLSLMGARHTLQDQADTWYFANRSL